MTTFNIFILLLACISLFTGIMTFVINLLKACYIPGFKASIILNVIISSIGLCYIILYCTNTL